MSINGLAFGEFSSDLRAGQRAARALDSTVGVQRHEKVFEWTYIFGFRDGAFFIQPDVQYTLQLGGTGEIPDALVVGTQVGFNF